MSDLTPEALDRLAQLDAAATPGPWEVTRRGIESPPYSDVLTGGPVECMAYCYGGSSTLEGDNLTADATLIAAMRTHLPALLDAARTTSDERRAAEGMADRLDRVAAERDALARWKAEALPVLAGVQELGRALGVDLGEVITARESVDLALDLRNERDAARAEVAALRERVKALDLSAMTEGSERIGTARWSQAERDAYSLAIEEAETAIRAALADPATDADQ